MNEDQPARSDSDSSRALLVAAAKPNYSELQSAGEDKDKELHEEKEFDIPEDAYGASVLAIVRDFQEVYIGKNVWVNLGTGLFSLLISISNLTLQFLLISFLSMYVVLPKVHVVQELYRDYHSHIFDEDGNFIEEEWENYGRQQELCQIAMTNKAFYSCSLLLWWAEMMREFRTSWRLFLNINMMPWVPTGPDMLKGIVEEDDDPSAEHQPVVIVGLTTWTKFWLHALVCFPKFMICVVLLWNGSEWLSATNKFESLIMNAVAMEFVTHIDELLFDVLLPAKYRTEVATIKFVVMGVKHPTKERARAKELWQGYRRSFIYVVLLVTGIYIYTEYLQNVLPHDVSHLRKHCQTYIDSVQPLCKDTFIDRFRALMTGRYASHECYPYG